MKTELFGGTFRRWLLWWGVLALAAAPELCLSQTSQPVITSITSQGTNVLVAVHVPVGVQRVVLESRARFGAGAWEPVLVAQLDGSRANVTFRLARTRQSEMLRVRAETRLPLPASFYTGTNSFAAGPTNNAVLIAGADGAVLTANPTPVTEDDSSREVVESDIWQLSGDTLYFFNQYRGLQVIDITDPDAAYVRGSLSLPASGEQMYLAGARHVVLLARNGCGSGTDGSQVLVVEVSDGVPKVVESLPIPGSIQESRMVGTALYVASQTYRPVSGTGTTTWEWGTVVSAFDLADPDHPVVRNTLWYPGYGNVVTATDTYLFVVTQNPTNWWQSIVRLIDVTAPDGTMAAYGSLRIAGRVADKFKLNYASGIFTSISEDTHLSTGSRVVTRLETFRLPDPRSAGPTDIVKLGQLELGNGERLHAARFDGDRVYIVTFFQIDPLWLVDLSDPAKPHIAGAVDVPGWSTYIMPLGGRLVTVGVEASRVAVSLFDVEDPAQPALLSRVLLGQNYSWSEANNDEKAFTVLPDIGLILVPYSGDTTNGWTSRVQLIDLNPTSLVARGSIEHQCQPRRATFSHQRILSLSGWELLSVDATDRDHPAVRGDTELAWPVDRVFVRGDYILEIGASSSGWGPQPGAAMRVAPRGEPDVVLSEVALGGLPVAGATIRENRLYLAQTPAYPYPILLDGGASDGDPGSKPNFVLTVLGLDDLPELPVLGQLALNVDLPAGSGNWQAVWPGEDLLVWAGGYVNFGWWGPWPGPILGGPVAGTGFAFCPIGSYGGGQLLAFDVSQPAEPKFASHVNLAANSWWSFSQPFVSGTLVYVSHQALETWTNDGWRQRSYLDVIDYTEPASPAVRKPINIPGTLQGLSHEGNLLYTTGYHWTSSGLPDGSEWLDALAYDPPEVHLVDSLALPQYWPHPVLAADANIFIGRPRATYTDPTGTPAELETWTLLDSGEFTRLGSVKLDASADTLLARNGLLAVRETDRSVWLFDLADPASLALLGHGYPASCLWYDLDQADGSVQTGLWIPLGMYGVGVVRPGP